MTPWTPDVEIDDVIATRLLTSRFPELGPLNLRLLGSGWDNHAYLVNESIVFRIPHRKLGAELMDTECSVLGFLGSQQLPLRIPEPQYIAAPDEGFPYTIAGYPMIEGSTADSVAWTLDERAVNAEPIGRFLSMLHRAPTNVPFVLGDELRRADLAYRLPTILDKLKSAPEGFRELLKDLASTPLAQSPVWIHGDLYSRHLVVDTLKRVIGVIDWGDVHVGDPALDIAIAWMFLPPPSWPAFRQGYGVIDDNTWRRARFRAMTHWVYLSQYADDRADQCLQRELNFVIANVMTR